MRRKAPRSCTARSAAMSAAAFFIPLCTLSVSWAEPDKDKLEQAYSKAYTKDRFTKADTNGDDVVSKAEAAAEARPVEKNLGGKRFDMADRDKDGVLTPEEAAAQKRREKKLYRFASAHPRTFRRLVNELAQRPRVARRLAGWAMDNPELARTDPAAARALARKLRNR